jgi:hypothetical protein
VSYLGGDIVGSTGESSRSFTWSVHDKSPNASSYICTAANGAFQVSQYVQTTGAVSTAVSTCDFCRRGVDQEQLVPEWSGDILPCNLPGARQPVAEFEMHPDDWSWRLWLEQASSFLRGEDGYLVCSWPEEFKLCERMRSMLTVDLITVTNSEFSFGPTGASFHAAVTSSYSTE